ncbi:exported protein (PHISTa) [Plasmodium gaboni]|uniref:Exported protein (PHISTa) n=1 Tax=Plasmodium gaboni TaxID=647221 RepID=A0A151LBN1_9APIC|nr:exported protein (PHISTa) [Plasmodium gaboni]KYN96351.1 exported protein (PHISTa) [Plasmodium gaboni]
MDEESEFFPCVAKYILLCIVGIICAELSVLHVMYTRLYNGSSFNNESLNNALPNAVCTNTKGRRMWYNYEDSDDEVNNSNDYHSINNIYSNNNDELLYCVDLVLSRIWHNLRDCSNREYYGKGYVVDYHDLSRNLKKEELQDVLKTLKEGTTRNDLISIWNHVVRINRSGVDDIISSILLYIDNVMNKYADCELDFEEVLKALKINERTLKLFKSNIIKQISSNDFKYNNEFYTLLINEIRIEDIKSLIDSYMKFADNKKKKIYDQFIKDFNEMFKKYIEKKKKN